MSIPSLNSLSHPPIQVESYRPPKGDFIDRSMDRLSTWISDVLYPMQPRTKHWLACAWVVFWLVFPYLFFGGVQ